MRTVLLAAFVSSSAALAEPPAHPWGRFQPGAWVTNKNGNASASIESKTTLLSVKDGQVSLQSHWAPPHERDVKEVAALGYLAPAADPKGVAGGSETLEIEGKKVTCVVTTWSGPDPLSGQTEVTECRAKGAALPLKLKRVSHFMGQTMTTLLVATRQQEELEVAGKKVKAVKLEGTVDIAGGGGPPTGLVQWWSTEVPGGLAREIRLKAGQEFSRNEVTGFGAK